MDFVILKQEFTEFSEYMNQKMFMYLVYVSSRKCVL